MGWETDTVDNYTCPCGKGKYQVIRKSDDFFRYKKECNILCDECKDRYFYNEIKDKLILRK